MYTGDSASVQSGILTGKAWDRTCHWIEDSVSSLTDSRTCGNYNNSQAPANTGTYSSNQKQLSGANDNWKTKNIYDLAGNVWEWTNEAGVSDCVRRGGGYSNNGSDNNVSCRNISEALRTHDHVGFRIRLYIKTN